MQLTFLEVDSDKKMALLVKTWVSLRSADKANKKYFQRRIRMPTAKCLKHNKWKLRYSNKSDQRVKNRAL